MDATLACGAFGQPVDLVLEGPAIELLKPPTATPTGRRNLFNLMASLPLYDVDRVYLLTEEPSVISEMVLEDLQIIPINDAELARLIASSRHVLSF